MTREQRTLSDWLLWRPSDSVATAKPANAATGTDSVGPEVASVAVVAVASEHRSYLWRVVTSNGSREVMVSGCPSLAEMRQLYPVATLTPLEMSTQVSKPIWNSEPELNAWLLAIGETDADVIAQLLADYRRWCRG